MGPEGEGSTQALETLLASLGVDDAPVFAEYVQSMVMDAAESEEDVPGAIESACAYIEELAGLEGAGDGDGDDDDGDDRLAKVAQELRRHWEHTREEAGPVQRPESGPGVSLQAIQSAMRAYREEDEAFATRDEAHRGPASEEAEIIKAATLARARQASWPASETPSETLLGPAIDNKAGGRTALAAEIQKKHEDRREHIRASTEARKAKKDAEERKKAHRLNMSQAKLKSLEKGREERSEKVRAQKQAAVRRRWREEDAG